MWFCPQDGVDVVLRTVITELTGLGRSAAALLVKEVRQSHSGQQGGRQAKACGGVAAILLAGADLSVVLLEDGGVALPALLVRDVAAPTDDPHVVTNVLVDFPTEVFFSVIWAVLEEFFCLGDAWAVGIVEWVCTVIVVVAVTLVAFNSRTSLHETEEEEEGGSRGDQF